MKKKIRVLPATVRVENVDLLEFLSDLPEILSSIPELSGSRASGVSLSTPKGTINMSFVSPGIFNLSGPNPEVLDALIEALKKYYEGKTE
jgi:hypothetical protein